MTSSLPGESQASDAIRQAGVGATFEIWQGPQGSIRYDWSRAGAIRLIIVGHGHTGFVAPSVRLFDTVVRFTGRIGVLFDCWDMTGYDSDFRVQTSAWATKHNSQVDTSFMVTRSKLVAMGISVANLAIGGKIKCFSNRMEFDLEAKKRGFPLNPPIPGR